MKPVTSPHSGEADSAATGTAPAARCCPECGKALHKPRRNQTYCSAACRASATERKRQRNAGNPMTACPECGTKFELTKSSKTFCSTQCQQDFNNFWKGRGARLALAMTDWRVRRTPGAMSKVCREFSQARDEQKDKRAKKRGKE